jgi:hypothetical protein
MMQSPQLDRRKSGRIGFVGRVERRKGQLALVRAFDQVRHARPEVKLELAGPVADTTYAREIEELIRDRRMSDSFGSVDRCAMCIVESGTGTCSCRCPAMKGREWPFSKPWRLEFPCWRGIARR